MDSYVSAQLQAPSPTPTAQSRPQPQGTRFRNSCDACQEAKLKCPRERPSCQRCVTRGFPCVYSALRRAGRPRKTTSPDRAESRYHQERPQNGQTEHQTGSTSHGSGANHLQMGGNSSTDVRSSYPTPNASTSSASSNLQRLPEQWFPNPESMDMMFDAFIDGTASQGDNQSILSHANSDSQLISNMTSVPNSLPSSAFNIDQFSVDMTGFDNAFATGNMDSYPDPTNAMDFRPEESADSRTNHESLADVTPPNDQSHRQMSLASSSSASEACQTGCFEHIIRHLEALENKAQGQILVNSILIIERETDAVRRKVVACPACMKNTRVFLLLSMTIEHTIAMFETLSDCRFLSGNQTDLDAPHTQNIELLFEKSLAGAEGQSRGIWTSEKLSLGNFEVTGEMKSEFVKQMIRRRLVRIADMLITLQKLSAAFGSNCNGAAADAIMKDSNHRIELLQGMLELWK